MELQRVKGSVIAQLKAKVMTMRTGGTQKKAFQKGGREIQKT